MRSPRPFAAVLCLLATPVFAGVKENQHQQMVQLAQEMRALKAQGAAGGSAYAALREQYAELSAALGGDDPGRMVPGGQPAEEPRGGSDPLPPPGCNSNVIGLANNDDVVIPATAPPNVVSSVINLALSPGIIYDVNVQVTITHTFNADLDITLTSPAGTVVTLTTDNGGGNDNVFNGTLFTDQANPGGQVPYTSNNGVASDQVYANLVVATPLVPEEALAAFIGESGLGAWTLTISDDLNLDGGLLDSWSITVYSFSPPQTASSQFTNNTPVVIPATAPPVVVSSTLAVSGVLGTILDLDLTTALAHTWNEDLDITLMSPAGTIVTLTTDNGLGHDNVFNGTVWDDDANPGNPVPYANNPGLATDRVYANNVLATPLVVEEALGAFVGENPNGTWTITISDDANLDGGTLSSWTLDFETASCSCLMTCPANVTSPTDPGVCQAAVSYAPPTTLGCFGAICVPPSGSTFPVGTTTVTCSESIPFGEGLTTCNFSVTVDDEEPPSIVPPPAQVAGTEAPACTAAVAYPPPSAGDNCGLQGVVCAPASGSTFPLGVTTVTCTATDTSGNMASGSTTVTVNDDDPPSVTAPDLVVPTDPGVCTGTATPTAIAADNCPGVGSSCAPPGPTWPLGVNPITCTATDGAGNQTSDAGSVTVNDLEAPVLTCPANIVEDLPPGVPSGPVTWSDPLVADNCPNPGAPTCVPPSGTEFTGGTTTPVNCSVTDASGNPAACSFTVTLNLVSILEIPTASGLGLAALALLLAAAAFVVLRRSA